MRVMVSIPSNDHTSSLWPRGRSIGVPAAATLTFEGMIAWQQRKTPEKSRAELEAMTLAYMAKMPAWKEHPRVRAAG